MALKQSYITVMLGRRYSSEFALFDMSTVIIHNTFKIMTPLIEVSKSK